MQLVHGTGQLEELELCQVELEEEVGVFSGLPITGGGLMPEGV